VTSALPPRWRTDEDLAAARQWFASSIPGFEPPVAYGVARVDDGELVFGHVNQPGGEHRLPAIVLASVCGHASGTATYELTTEELRRAAELLAPAEAAVHWQHPNLWSWRQLLDEAGPGTSYLAFFVGDVADPPVDERDTAFRARLSG
jgi:hypothetical protein